MSTYTAENVKDLDITTPTESSTPPSEVNNSDREIKDVIKNQWATIVKSVVYTLTPQDSLVLVSGTTTITIPASTDVSSSTFFKQYTIIKTDAAGTNVTIARTGSDTFNGATSITLTKQYEGAIIFGSGVADWKYLPINNLVAGTDYLTPTGNGSGLTGISTSDTITNMPAGAYTVTAAQCTGRIKLTNAGAGASSVTPTLPAGAANHTIHFSHIDSGNLIITPNGTQHLYLNGVSLGAGVAYTSTTVGATYTLIWNSSGGWWELYPSFPIGTPVTKSANTEYQATASAGIVVARGYSSSAAWSVKGIAEATSGQTSYHARARPPNGGYATITFFVPKNYYWQALFEETYSEADVTWYPLI